MMHRETVQKAFRKIVVELENQIAYSDSKLPAAGEVDSFDGLSPDAKRHLYQGTGLRMALEAVEEIGLEFQTFQDNDRKWHTYQEIAELLFDHLRPDLHSYERDEVLVYKTLMEMGFLMTDDDIVMRYYNQVCNREYAKRLTDNLKITTLRRS